MQSRHRISIIFAPLFVVLLVIISVAEAATYQLYGQVTDQFGTPLEGSIVAILELNTGVAIESASADVYGNYAIFVEEGTYDVRVTPPLGSGFAESITLEQVIDTDTNIDFVLVPIGLVTVNGRVVNQEGIAVSTATIELQGLGGGNTQTDSSGNFSLSVSADEHRLMVESFNNDPALNLPDSFGIWTDDPIPFFEDTTLDDIVIPANQVIVHVQDPTGNPIPDVVISVGYLRIDSLFMADFPAFGNSTVSPANTDTSGNTSMWLFPTDPSRTEDYYRYTFTATPPAGTPFAQTEVTGVAVEDNKTVNIILQSQLNQPPSADAGGGYIGAEATIITFNGGGSSDPDTGDTLTYEWDLDYDGITFMTDVTGTISSVTFIDNFLIRTIGLRVTDSSGASDIDTSTLEVFNVPPTADFNNDGPVEESSNFMLSLVSQYDPSSADTDAGFEYVFDCGDGYSAYNSSNNITCSTDDSGTRIVAGKIRDKDGGETEYTNSVIINNVAPTVIELAFSLEPINIDAQSSFTIDVSFSDPAGTNDEPYTCEFDLDYDGETFTPDATVNDVTYSSCSTVFDYAEPGVYAVMVVVTDKDGDSGSAVATDYIVIFDDEGGFVTGGGWIWSEPGWCQFDTICAETEGKANFGFVSKYNSGASSPTGNTEFNFNNFNFHSDSYDWLVVNQGGANALFKGTGTINGVGDYKFMLWVADLNPDEDDTFRIKIWYEDGNGQEVIVYDNGFGQPIGGGNIKVH